MIREKKKPYRFETREAEKKNKLRLLIACIVMAVLLVFVGNGLRYLKKLEEAKQQTRTESVSEEAGKGTGK